MKERAMSKSERLSPAMIAKAGTEHAEQAALMCHVQMELIRWPELKWLHAIPNGGSREVGSATGQVTGRLKAEGVKSGVCDLYLPVARGGYFGLYIEMKKKRGGATSDSQDDFGMFVLEQGFLAVVCHGWEQARDVLAQYCAWPNTPRVQCFKMTAKHSGFGKD